MVSKPGDIARVKMPKGDYKGDYIARVTSIREIELFAIKPLGRKQTFTGTHKYCQIVLRPDD